MPGMSSKAGARLRGAGAAMRRLVTAPLSGHQWGIAGSPVRAGDTVAVATIAGSLLGFPLLP
jgi:hypothetical protein